VLGVTVLDLLNILRGPDHFLRIDRISTYQDLKMEMLASRGIARVSDVAQQAFCGDLVTHFDQQLSHVRTKIQRRLSAESSRCCHTEDGILP